MVQNRRLSRQELARRIEIACKTIAIEEGCVPTVDQIHVRDILAGNSPRISRSSIFHYVKELADESDPRTPFEQYLPTIGIRKAVIVDGKMYEAKE